MTLIRSMFKLSMKEFAILDVHHFTYNELNADKILLNLQERIIFLNKFIIVRIISHFLNSNYCSWKFHMDIMFIFYNLS